MATYRTLATASLAAMAISLTACGGGGSGGSAAPPAVAVAPAPTPTPTLAPTPTPTPTPAAAARGPADALPGDALTGFLACAQGSFAFATEADGSRRLTGVSTISGVTLGEVELRYAGPDTYALAIDGAGGPSFASADKRAPLSLAYDYFRKAGDELEIYRNALSDRLALVTLGRLNDSSRLCFYAAGLYNAFEVPGGGSSAQSIGGFVDGIAQLGGRTLRLFGSRATGSIDFTRRTGTISIELAGRDAAFGEFTNSAATPIGTASATLNLDGEGEGKPSGTLSGPGGSTGTVRGQVYILATSVGFAFTLTYPNGDRIIGSAAF